IVHRILSLLLSYFFFSGYAAHRDLHSFPTRRSSDLNLKLGVVRIAFLQFMLIFLQGADVLIRTVSSGQPGHFGLEEPANLNYLQDEVRVEPEVIEQME